MTLTSVIAFLSRFIIIITSFIGVNTHIRYELIVHSEPLKCERVNRRPCPPAIAFSDQNEIAGKISRNFGPLNEIVI